MRILGIDPGTTNLGLGFMDVDDKGVILKVSTFNLNALDYFRLDGTGSTTTDDLNSFLRTYYLTSAISKYIEYHDPDIACVESPFAAMRRVQSYAVLSEHFNRLNDVMAENRLETFHYAPMQVKSGFGCAGKKGKKIMKEAMKEIPEIMDVLSNDVEGMSEHEVDAVAVCYIFLKKSREGVL